MHRSINEILGYRVLAVDERVGKIKDMLFDDQTWNVRYIVIDTGSWLSDRKVIVSTQQLEEPNWELQTVSVALTAKDIEASPPLNANEPVSRRYERLWHEKFNQPVYWAPLAPTETPVVADVAILDEAERKAAKARAEEEKETTHLRSVNEVCGYSIRATDGEIGRVDDFIVDDEDWLLRYLAVDTRKWLPGGKVLVSIGWLRSVDWPAHEVSVSLPRDLIKESPKYNPSEPVNREYETRLYDYYGRPHYWLNG